MEFKVQTKVPFPTPRHATIAKTTLEPDPELRPSEFSHHYEVQGSTLLCNFEATSDRNLRVGINSIMESLALICETMDSLGDGADL